MSMSLSMSSSRLSGGGGLSLGGGLGGARLGMGMGGGAGGLGLGLGGGGGLALGLGLGGGFGGGAGGGAGFGMGGGGGGLLLGGGGGGFGLGGGGGGLALGGGGGGGGGGMLMASPAFTMGRTMAAGGIGGGSALAAAALAVPSLAPMQTRAAEKHTLSTLNDRFSAYMTKVRSLQQENTALEAKLSQLTGGTDMSPEASSTTVEFEAQLGEYRGMLEALTLDTIKLEIELDNVRGTAHEIKAKYDFEQGVKFQLEADIGAMKRDIEMASDLRIEMDAKFSSLKDELDFVTKTQEEELSALQAKLGTTTAETSVSMIEVDTDKSFDIANALNKLRVDYEKTVQQHRAEAEAYYKLKMDEMQTATVQSSEAISSTKVEILATKKELLVLGLELQGLVTANMSLEHSLAEAHAQSSVGLAEAQAQIVSLTSAIEVAKSDLHKQILAYQELLDIKLALDVEISTYRKLLEGDDFKLPEFTETSFTFTGSAPTHTSTPHGSPLPPALSDMHEAGGGGIQVKEIITEETETSVISDAEST